jgi:hypothetical protein
MEWFDRNAARDRDEVVADYLARLKASSGPASPSLPSAEVLWVKGQMLRRWDNERKAQAPLDLMEPVQIAAGLAAAAVLFVWSLPSLIQAFGFLRG